jgi:hypothetical protein
MLPEERLVMEESMSAKELVDVYNKVALLMLDHQGQLEVADLVATGEYPRAQQILVVQADLLCESEQLSLSEREAIFAQLGLSLQTVAEIRSGGGYIGMRGILHGVWVFTTQRDKQRLEAEEVRRRSDGYISSSL